MIQLKSFQEAGMNVNWFLIWPFSYLNSGPLDTEVLFAVFAGLESSGSCLDITWVPRDVRELCQGISNKKEVLISCMDRIASTDLDATVKARIIRLILLPITAAIKDQGQSFVKTVGNPFLQKIEKTILSRECIDAESVSNILSLEELQFICLILSFDSAATELKTLSTAMKRFLLSRNSSPDPVIRYSALLLHVSLLVKWAWTLNSLIRLLNHRWISQLRKLDHFYVKLCPILCLVFWKDLVQPFLKSWLPDILSDLSKNSHFLAVIAVFWSNFIQMEAELTPHRDILIRPLISCLSKAALSMFSVHEHRSYPFEISAWS